MRLVRLILSAALTILLLLASSSVSYAQATRTWVSGVGDDANPCSRTAPCKTFAGAISKTAGGGEIDVLDPGGFGALTINSKSLTIDGGAGQVASVLVSGSNGFNIVSTGAIISVTLRNLSINGVNSGLNGIRMTAGGELHIEHVTIFGFTQNGIDIEPMAGAADQVFINDTLLHDNTIYGVNVSPAAGGTANVSMNGVQASNNSVGFWGQDGSNLTIVNSLAAGNLRNGFKAHSGGGAAQMNITFSTAANNGGIVGAAGIKSDGPAAIVYIGNNTIVNNTNGLFEAGGGQIISFGNNNIGGNGADGAPTSTIGTH